MSATALLAGVKPMSSSRKIRQSPKGSGWLLGLACLLWLNCPGAQAGEYGHWSNYLDNPGTPYRVLQLAADLPAGPLRTALEQCVTPLAPNRFSIAHRGAPALFPEHTRESYLAAANQGAGVIECDVTFTQDGALVCRHSQCDLHRTTNILETPLQHKCRTPFRGATSGEPAQAECCTSELTLTEFQSLCGKHDSADPSATTAAGYMHGGPARTPGQYPGCGQLMTLDDSIELIQSLGRAHAPELKSADGRLPYSQAKYAQRLIDRYRAHRVDPSAVFVQSFNPKDIAYWLAAEPTFARQAVLLDGRDAHVDPQNPSDPGVAGHGPSFTELRAMGLRYLAPPLWYLMRLDGMHMAPSEYALQARSAGLALIAWTLERSGPIQALIEQPRARGYYYRSVLPALRGEADVLRVLDLLAKDVGVQAVFSDWPETTTAYANCVLENGLGP